MIPYFPEPALQLGRFRVTAFGVLLVLAVYVGGRTMLRRAHRMGIGLDDMFQFCFYILAAGLVGAHLAKILMENLPGVLADPSILVRNGGIRSLGGLSGGFLGALVWCRVRKLSLFETMRRLDIVAYALPLAWMFGRLGCALAHDHRGLFTDSWIAVTFPEGSRYDLGLIEFVFLAGLALAFWILDRWPRPVGFFFGLYGVVYGGFRIWLDTLHIQPMRFYGGVVGVVIGILGWAVMSGRRDREERSIG